MHIKLVWIIFHISRGIWSAPFAFLGFRARLHKTCQAEFLETYKCFKIKIITDGRWELLKTFQLFNFLPTEASIATASAAAVISSKASSFNFSWVWTMELPLCWSLCETGEKRITVAMNFTCDALVIATAVTMLSTFSMGKFSSACCHQWGMWLWLVK